MKILTPVTAAITAALVTAPAVRKFNVIPEVTKVAQAAETDWSMDDLREAVAAAAGATVADGDYAAVNGDVSALNAVNAFEAGESPAFVECLFEVFGLGDPDQRHWRAAREAYVARLEEIDG